MAYDSAGLLALFDALAGRAVADGITPAEKYERLSRAQVRVIAKMMSVCPESLYPKAPYTSLPTLTTTDNQVYTFGTDAQGFAQFPSGRGGIYASLNDIPDNPWVEGQDFITEGTQIRIPNNNTGPATLYWYGVSQPNVISASVQPALFPEGSRELIAIEAVRQFAKEYVRNLSLADEMQTEFDSQWVDWCLVWKTQFRSGGALASFTGFQLAVLGQY